MNTFIPYLVLIGVIAAFFLVCYWVFREKPYKRGRLTEAHRADRRRKIREYVSGTMTAEGLKASSHVHKPVSPTVPPAQVEPLHEQEEPAYGNVSIHGGTPESMTLVIPPIEEVQEDTQPLSSMEEIVETNNPPLADDITQDLGGIPTKSEQKALADAGATQVMERVATSDDETAPTTIIRRDELSAALANQGLMESNPVVRKEVVKDYSSSPWKQESAEEERIKLAMEPFRHVFGVISERTYDVVSDVTRHALLALDISSKEEIQVLLDNVVVQEALLLMQKAYAANPSDWMRPIAVDAFVDVVTQAKSSTPYLVAFDALKIMSHLSLAHVQVMAIVLLLQYSRNSNNYSMEYFRHYVNKYIEPFVSELPRNAEIYHQLEYLHCTQKETEKVTLAQLLSNSYSFVFNFRGFTKDELFHVLDGESLDSRFVVKSLNSSLYKLALVDEAMAPRFFRQTRITDSQVQKELLQLMKSKPSAFSGTEARRIMDEISPTLLDLADLFDNSPLATMSLTLLGLYLGRAHVKAQIHEDFDLSQWF